MLEKIKKHGVKILVLLFNVLLAAIAALVIREKDQARLLENAQKEIPAHENSNEAVLPSFEGNLAEDKPEEASSAESAIFPADASVQPLPAADKEAVSSPTAPAPSSAVPADPVPVPAKKTTPADTKTKTS